MEIFKVRLENTYYDEESGDDSFWFSREKALARINELYEKFDAEDKVKHWVCYLETITTSDEP